MKFDFKNTSFDGKRLTKMFRASVHNNGSLYISPDASRTMGLSLDHELLVCPYGEKDLAVTVVPKGNARGFVLKKSGPYFYVPFKSLLTECGLDWRSQTIVYDIIELAEKYEGASVWKFNRRFIPHQSDAAAGEATAARDEETPPVFDDPVAAETSEGV